MVAHSPRRVTGLLLIAALALTGCASHEQASNSSPSTSYAAAFPVTLTPPGAPGVTLATAPQRIVSLDSSDTETLFAVGAGSQVVAVDKDSDYPPNVPKSQLDATKPNVEAIAAYHPDLVVTGYDTDNLVSALRRIDIPVLQLTAPQNLDQAYQIWSTIGRATGHQAQADALISNARNEINAAVATTPKPGKALSYYYELDQTYYTATSHTFIGGLLGRFGLTDIADPADSPAAGGYPQLSAEQVLAADPTLIFLADNQCCGQNAATVAARPGWSTLAAVRSGNVVALNDDIASRWGPRIVDLVRTVAAAVTKAAGRTP
jgi:iron complex transport system substrate-binding protein